MSGLVPARTVSAAAAKRHFSTSPLSVVRRGAKSFRRNLGRDGRWTVDAPPADCPLQLAAILPRACSRLLLDHRMTRQVGPANLSARPCLLSGWRLCGAPLAAGRPSAGGGRLPPDTSQQLSPAGDGPHDGVKSPHATPPCAPRC